VEDRPRSNRARENLELVFKLLLGGGDTSRKAESNCTLELGQTLGTLFSKPLKTQRWGRIHRAPQRQPQAWGAEGLSPVLHLLTFLSECCLYSREFRDLF
jgi:hypothetical protein